MNAYSIFTSALYRNLNAEWFFSSPGVLGDRSSSLEWKENHRAQNWLVYLYWGTALDLAAALKAKAVLLANARATWVANML
jgi:hypothetical protein